MSPTPSLSSAQPPAGAVEVNSIWETSIFVRPIQTSEEAVPRTAKVMALEEEVDLLRRRVAELERQQGTPDATAPAVDYVIAGERSGELSMEVETANQLAKGEADLVLETEKGLILIDYKSYAGIDDVTNPNCEYYAGKYSGQLDLYAQMLEKTLEPQKVIKKLIYYVVQGKIVELS